MVMIQQGLLPFKIEHTDEFITPRSGQALFAEVMRAFKIGEKVGEYFPEPGSNRGYEAWSYVEPLLLMMEGGGRHVEDLREIRDDQALRALTGLEEMPSVSTFGDWLTRTGSNGGIPAVTRIVEESAERTWKRLGTPGYTLDVDATVIEAEKKEAEWTYKKVRGYQPLLGYLAENGVCVERPKSRLPFFQERSSRHALLKPDSKIPSPRIPYRHFWGSVSRLTLSTLICYKSQWGKQKNLNSNNLFLRTK
jgi:hypothetical protein